MFNYLILFISITLIIYMYVQYILLNYELNNSKKLMNLILSHIGDGVIISDNNGKTISTNSIVNSITNIDEKNLKSLSSDSILKTISKIIYQNSQDGNSKDSTNLICEDDCINKSVLVTKKRNGEIYNKVTILHNLFECTTAHQIIHKMAHYDSLTGLANRSYINELLNLELETSKKNNSETAVVFIDLDNFKIINDTLGHDIGDLVLKEVSSKIQKHLGNEAHIGRLGGDEFLIILPEIKSPNDSLNKINKLLDDLNGSLPIDNKELFITASAGISICPLHSTDAKTLLKNADIAMYNAKNKGKNQCLIFNEEMSIERSTKLEIIEDLKNAIDNNEFKLFYQPKVDIMTNKMIGVEALIRWFHPKKGIIPPSKFIPIAEETGLILPIGEWVLLEGCRQNKIWQQSNYSPIEMSINLSTHQFEHPSIINTIKDILNKTQLDPKWLELEITESIAVKSFEYASRKLSKLKEIGVSVAMDDFGTGYSSFSYLKHLPIDTLKIDKTFLDDIANDTNEELITASMINLGKRLNLTVVAEGVENNEQLSFLKTNKCNIAQGYLFSKPIPSSEIEKLF
ncbi:GGDEF domain-containing phosphodiesterase [Clostridium paridis]|uniref:EAL domain-containing protein n=1 Tax=Clostridium paridis TaxID=2803863 RepID=A0A937FD35_9CLOT|nr:GGDEF domain-containing phosphodiesterase [Clostridium paridis]MBL4930979.1 EAL domain-containing protein [Clostridium paridis]